MSSNLRGSLEQLCVLLKRHFRPHGIPPKMPEWRVKTDRKHESEALNEELGDSATFRALISEDVGNPRLAEFLANVEPLREVAEALRLLIPLLKEQRNAGRVSVLFDQLLEKEWLQGVSSHFKSYADGKKKFFIGFTARKIGKEFLNDLRRASEDIRSIQPAARDENGNETPTKSQPDVDDDSAFVAAKTLRVIRRMTAAACNKFLTQHGTTSAQPVEGKVRYHKPNIKRLDIHAGDWHKFWQAVERRQSDALDEDAMQEFLANAEAEKAKRKFGRASSR